MSEAVRCVPAVIVRGHGVASGSCGDARFPEGTLRMQWPHFAERGLDLSGYHAGTINVSIAPWHDRVRRPWRTFRNVKWSTTESAEDFSFIRCRIHLPAHPPVEGLVYHPHPETKPEHFQPPDVLELLAPWVSGVREGQTLVLEVPPAELELMDSSRE